MLNRKRCNAIVAHDALDDFMFYYRGLTFPWWIQETDPERRDLEALRKLMRPILAEKMEKAYDRAKSLALGRMTFVIFATFLQTDSPEDYHLAVHYSHKDCGSYFETEPLEATNLVDTGWWVAMAYLPSCTKYQYLWQIHMGPATVAYDMVRDVYVLREAHFAFSNWRQGHGLLTIPKLKEPMIDPKPLSKEMGILRWEEIPAQLLYLDKVIPDYMEIPPDGYVPTEEEEEEEAPPPSQKVEEEIQEEEVEQPAREGKKAKKYFIKKSSSSAGERRSRRQSRLQRFGERVREGAARFRRWLKKSFVCGASVQVED